MPEDSGGHVMKLFPCYKVFLAIDPVILTDTAVIRRLHVGQPAIIDLRSRITSPENPDINALKNRIAVERISKEFQMKHIRRFFEFGRKRGGRRSHCVESLLLVILNCLPELNSE